MWNKSVGLIILLKIVCVSIRADDDVTGSRTYNVDWIAEKEYKLIFDEVSWYTANEICRSNGMKLATINSQEEHQFIESVIRDKYMVDQQFWISKSVVALERTSKWTQTQTLPQSSTRRPSNQCTSWYWLNAEICFALLPLANEWRHEDCSEEKYFICEQIHDSEKELLKVVEDELVALIDELMFTGFAEALSTTPENEWASLVEGALHTWIIEQQQISTPTSLLDERVKLIAAEMVHIAERPLEIDELRLFVNTEFEVMDDEDRVQLLSERFRKFIGDEYARLAAGSRWSRSPSHGDINVLVKKVITLAKAQEIKLASEELAKFSDMTSTEVLDEDHMKWISEQLLKFGESEFESYVLAVMAQLESFGVEQVDMNVLFQLYLLVKQELFSLIARTVLKATAKERIEIANYDLTLILEGKQLVDEDSIFGQIFVMLGTGTAVLSKDLTVNAMDDVLLRKFVKKEFDDLRQEDMLKLKYEGYMKFVIDEVIRLVSDINLAKSESGELLLKNVVDLIATQFIVYAEEELKVIAARLAQSIEQESSKREAAVKSIRLAMYDEGKLLKLIDLVQQELFTIIMKSLINFTEPEMLVLAEEGLSRILVDDKPIGNSIEKIYVAMGEEVLKMTTDEFAVMNDEELVRLVKLKFEKANYEKSTELFREMYMSLMTEEFVKLIEDEAIMLAPHEEEKHQFGEIVRLIAKKLLEIADSASFFV